MSLSFPTTRMRRLRYHPKIRDLVRETQLSVNDFILPLFITHANESQPVSSMPGMHQWCLNDLAKEVEHISSLGIPAVLLFGLPAEKDELGTDTYHDEGIVQQAIRRIKSINPELLVITDLCFCEYMPHGHCGVIHELNGKLECDNDATLALLAKQALSHAQAGSDMLAPSGNIDGMVQSIREALDTNDFQHLPILSYSVKYCSSLYGPFREATDGAPQFGDRTSYQMDPANGKEALREVASDVAEGADMVMVKPASTYLDVIYQVKHAYPAVPLCAYQVSGEYSMIKAAANNGWIDGQRVLLESTLAIKRAGADFIITYAAKELAQCLQG